MAVILYKNPCDYAFLMWMGSFPDSFHPLDMERFYQFAKCVARYRSKKWLDYTYFEAQILKHTPHFSEDNIETFWNKLTELVKYHRTPLMPEVGAWDDKGYGYYQRGVMDGKIYEVKISEREYLGKGATKETMSNAKFIGE